MKKIATTIALSALFMTGVMDSANAWILTWGNKTTDNQLINKYGESYKKEVNDFRIDFINAARFFEREAKKLKVQNNPDIKAVITLFDKIAAALKDVYQAEKSTVLFKSLDAAINYYNQNPGAFLLAIRILGNNLQQFEEAFKNLSVPQATDYTGEIALRVEELLNIIRNLQNQMTDQTVQAPVAQPQAVITPAPVPPSTSSNNSSSNDGNWMFEKNDTATSTVAPQTTTVVAPVKVTTPAVQLVTPQTTVQPQTATVAAPVTTPVVQTTMTPRIFNIGNKC